jgi:hypothetical protein
MVTTGSSCAKREEKLITRNMITKYFFIFIPKKK